MLVHLKHLRGFLQCFFMWPHSPQLKHFPAPINMLRLLSSASSSPLTSNLWRFLIKGKVRLHLQCLYSMGMLSSENFQDCDEQVIITQGLLQSIKLGYEIFQPCQQLTDLFAKPHLEVMQLLQQVHFVGCQLLLVVIAEHIPHLFRRLLPLDNAKLKIIQNHHQHVSDLEALFELNVRLLRGEPDSSFLIKSLKIVYQSRRKCPFVNR